MTYLEPFGSIEGHRDLPIRVQALVELAGTGTINIAASNNHSGIDTLASGPDPGRRQSVYSLQSRDGVRRRSPEAVDTEDNDGQH